MGAERLSSTYLDCAGRRILTIMSTYTVESDNPSVEAITCEATEDGDILVLAQPIDGDAVTFPCRVVRQDGTERYGVVARPDRIRLSGRDWKPV